MLMLICKCFFLSNGRVCKGLLVLLCFDAVLWRVVSCVVAVGTVIQQLSSKPDDDAGRR